MAPFRSCLLCIALVPGAMLSGEAAFADTLQEALLQAYETNPDLNAARARLRATDEDVALAKAEGRPRANADASYSEFLQQSNAGSSAAFINRPDRSFGVSATLSVPVYQGGGVRNRVRAAETRVDSGRADLRGSESGLFSQVVATYMNVIRDVAIVELRQENVDTLRINLEATSDRFEIGDLTRTDVAQSEARLALGTANLEVAQSNLVQSRENYIALVGEAPTDLQPPPPLPGLPSSVEEATRIALAENPDLLAARRDADAAFYDRRASDSGRLPSVSVFAQPGYDNFLGSAPNSSFGGIGAPVEQAGTSLTVGVQATVPLYQGGAGSARIRQAQARQVAAQESFIAAERNVISQVRSAYRSWRAALSVIRASERQVAAAELSLEGVRAENTVGLRSILDILNAEQELTDAEVQLVTARRDAYVAGFSLLAAMGKAEARDLDLDGAVLYDPIPYYERSASSWLDWAGVPDEPEPRSTRTVDTEAQTAETDR